MSNATLPILNCDDCGACCMDVCCPPFLGPDDPELVSLPDHVREDYDHGMAEQQRIGWSHSRPCFWLDPETKRCRHYDYRPIICRRFPAGGVDCLLLHGEVLDARLASALFSESASEVVE